MPILTTAQDVAFDEPTMLTAHHPNKAAVTTDVRAVAANSKTTRDFQVDATIRDCSYARPPAAELNHTAETWQE